MFMLGGIFLNKPITSKQDIIKICQEMVQENGISSVNMRSVASNVKFQLVQYTIIFHLKLIYYVQPLKAFGKIYFICLTNNLCSQILLNVCLGFLKV